MAYERPQVALFTEGPWKSALVHTAPYLNENGAKPIRFNLAFTLIRFKYGYLFGNGITSTVFAWSSVTLHRIHSVLVWKQSSVNRRCFSSANTKTIKTEQCERGLSSYKLCVAKRHSHHALRETRCTIFSIFLRIVYKSGLMSIENVDIFIDRVSYCSIAQCYH